MRVRQPMKKLKKTRNTAMSSSSFATRSKSMLKWSVTELRNMTASSGICKRAVLANAVTDSMTLNTCINVRVHPNPARNRSYSSCPGAQTQRKLRRRCCILGKFIILYKCSYILTNNKIFNTPYTALN